MKKLFCLFIFCNLALTGFAFSVGDLFIKNSRFWQNEISASILERDTISAGFVFDITDYKDVNDKIYAFHLPFMLSFPIVDLTIVPFWYPDANDASAYGGSVKLEGILRSDDINNVYASGYLKTAFANQKANIVRGISPMNKENFKQWAFEGGLNFNLANLYNFNVNGNIFNYPDGAKDVVLGGIMNQNELADLGTIDYVLNLPRFSTGGSITWLSSENNTKTSLSYKYINYEDNLIAHSVMLKTMIPITKKLVTTLIYNHLFEKHHTNRDLFGIGLNYLF